MTILIVVLGGVAGALTTLTGAGGGVFLIVSLSLLIGPHEALAATAPALLAGNLHRLVLYRKLVDRDLALRLVAGALPGAIVGGLLLVSIPPIALRVLLLGVTGYAVLRAFGLAAWMPPRAALVPAGAAVGGIAATSGGAGLLAAPILLSSGLTGRPYVATGAAVALATHVGRLAAYGARGLMTRDVLLVAAIATVAVVTGNAFGDRLRVFFDDRRTSMLEYATLALCGVLALAGLGS